VVRTRPYPNRVRTAIIHECEKARTLLVRTPPSVINERRGDEAESVLRQACLDQAGLTFRAPFLFVLGAANVGQTAIVVPDPPIRVQVHVVSSD
jgi:hypothetical protein